MIKIDTFELKHLEGFKPKTPFVDLAANMELNMLNVSRHLLSLLYKDKLVCIAGVNYHREGVGEVWLVPSAEVDEHKFLFYKAIQWLIDSYLMGSQNLHRLEMSIRVDWEKGIRWAQRIGFEREGLARQWSSDKKDYILYAKVK